MEAFTRLLRLLVPEEKARLWRVLALAVVAGILETLAVLSVLPFMAAAANPDLLMGHPVGAWAGRVLGLDQPSELLFAGGAAVLILVVLANAVGMLRIRQVLMTAWNIHHYLSRRLLAAYLSRPYPWFLDRHSSGMTRNLLDEVNRVIQGVLVPLLTAGVRGVAALLLVLLLLSVDAVLTLAVALVLGGAYVLIYLAIRVLQDRLGKMRAGAYAVRFQVVTEALGGIKEVKSLGVEEELIRRFDRTGSASVRSAAWSQVLAEVPRYVLEVLSVGTVLAIFLFLLGSGQPVREALPVLSLFAFAGYKLVPAFHQVYTGVTVARYHLAPLRELEEDLLGGVREEVSVGLVTEPLPVREAVELAGVAFRYPKAERRSLEGIDLRIRRGERWGVVGPTGAGKTTLVDLLLGLLEPEEGEFRVDAQPLEGELWTRWRAAVGYVPQSLFLADDTVTGNIAFGVRADAVSRERVEAAAQMAELDAFIRELPQGYDTYVGERGVRISGGQRQRIGIARALYRDPALLLLDEATSALDGATEEAVMDAVFGLERERTVVIVAHRLSTVRRCDRILVLEGGRVAAVGTWEELLETSDLFRVLARLDSPSPKG